MVANVAVDVDRPPAAPGQEGNGGPQQYPAVGALIARVAVGKMTADITQRRRPEQRVGDRMEQRVGVGVSEESGLVGNLDAAKNQIGRAHV